MSLPAGSAVYARWIQGTGHFLMARVRGNAGTPITVATIGSIRYAVTNLDTGVQQGSGTLVVASVVFDTLQAGDPRWPVDSAGYNFAAVIPAAAFSAGGKTRVDVEFTPVSGEKFVVPFEGPALGTYLGAGS